jgi:hypothetical protein
VQDDLALYLGLVAADERDFVFRRKRDISQSLKMHIEQPQRSRHGSVDTEVN